MPKPNIDEVLDIKDPLLSDNFEFLIPTVPGSEGDASRALRIQVKTAIKPGMTLEEVMYELFGHQAVHAGRLTFTHEMTVEYVENYKANITQIFEDWMEYARTTQDQSGHFKTDYATDAKFIIYDQEGEKTLTYKLVNVWPKTVQELSFDGGAATLLTSSIGLAFDYFEKES